MENLGMTVIDSIKDYHKTTHLVVPDNDKHAPRTFKALVGYSTTSNIVPVSYINSCIASGEIIDPEPSRCTNLRFEEDGFELKTTIMNGEEARQYGGILSGYWLRVAPNVASKGKNLKKDELNMLGELLGANLVYSDPQLGIIDDPSKIIIIKSDVGKPKLAIQEALDNNAIALSHAELIQIAKRQICDAIGHGAHRTLGVSLPDNEVVQNEGDTNHTSTPQKKDGPALITDEDEDGVEREYVKLIQD